ncbi:MAG TPA: hypothetical protein VMV27_15470 [Candidatus Binataceae bacterium]|nr:hypothetical protein [Candidatus Binataceae bacterium]
MERTSIRLGGVELQSSIMNASGPRSAERGEIYELAAVHRGAIVFKSCNLAGLDAPDNLKNAGVEHFAAIAGALAPRGKVIIASIVGASEEEVIAVARRLERSGAAILELNLADPYVLNSIAPFASLDRLKALIERVRGAVGCVLAVKLAPAAGYSARALAGVLKSTRVAIAVCQNDPPKDLEIDLATGIARGPERALSHAHAIFREGEGLLDVVAVGGINTGRDAYLAHLMGATAVQVGSALIKEGAGALGRIDRELDALLAEHGKRSVGEIVGQLSFEPRG